MALHICPVAVGYRGPNSHIGGGGIAAAILQYNSGDVHAVTRDQNTLGEKNVCCGRTHPGAQMITGAYPVGQEIGVPQISAGLLHVPLGNKASDIS